MRGQNSEQRRHWINSMMSESVAGENFIDENDIEDSEQHYRARSIVAIQNLDHQYSSSD